MTAECRDLIKIKKELPWSEEAEPVTVRATGISYMVRRAPIINGDFWTIWKRSKDDLKEGGISVRKKNGRWEASWWSPLDAYIEAERAEPDLPELGNDGGLLDCQIDHVRRLLASINRNGGALDASDVGTGKTYCALAVARALGVQALVICPKGIISYWHETAFRMGVRLLDAINYEMLRTGSTDYLEMSGDDGPVWNLPSGTLLIWDEVHRCRGLRTLNSGMLIAAREAGYVNLMLSATVADNPLHLRSIGYALSLFPTPAKHYGWCLAHGCCRNQFKTLEFNGLRKHLTGLHRLLFPVRGSRLMTADFGDEFPDGTVTALAVNLESSGKIDKIYAGLRERVSELRKLEASSAEIMTEMLRARQAVELLKVPAFVEMALDLMNDGCSVAIFVNFTDTLDAVCVKLKTTCTVHGAQTAEERNAAVAAFQHDEERIIVCNIKAGGVGLSLHDLHGNHPRVSLLAPTWSAVDLVQALGRIRRARAMSPAVQRIIYAAGTVEERVRVRVAKKISNLTVLNDGDLAEEPEWTAAS